MAEGEEKLLAEFPGVRHKKQDGVLLLTSARVAWSSGGGERLQLNFPYPQIKAQRISAESSSKVQLQLVLHSGGPTTINFHFTGDTATEQRNQAKQLLQGVLRQYSQANPDLEVKTSLLNSDPALYQLYKDLVVGGLISAEEFWANRLAKKEPETSTEQERGLPSAFLADVQAVSGCNAVKYNLTTDVIQAIFRTYPSVRAKHTELVPAKMREEEFWVQFFQSQLFHRDPAPSSSSSSSIKDLFSDCLSQEHRSIVQEGQSSGTILNTSESPAVDSLGKGYSILPDVQPSTSAQTSLVQRCNHHSSMVLRATLQDSSGDQPQQQPECPTPPDTQLRLRPTQHSQHTSTSPSSLLTLAHHIASWTPQQSVNSVAVHSAVGYLVPGGALMPSGGVVRGKGAELSQSQRDQLFRHQAAVAELLRHFWACFPVLSPQLEEKVHQMGRCLHEYQESRLPELASALGPGEAETVNYLRTSIAVALERYHTWQSKRNKS